LSYRNELKNRAYQLTAKHETPYIDKP